MITCNNAMRCRVFIKNRKDLIKMNTNNKNIIIKPFSTGNEEFHNLPEANQDEILSNLSQTIASTLDTYLNAIGYNRDAK